MNNNSMPPQGYGPQFGPQPYGPPPPYGPQPNQPYPTYPPQPVAPKKPMSPKTKKTIIIVCASVGGALVLGIAALIILPMLLKVDYKRTSELADSVNSVRSSMRTSDSCGGVITYVDSSYYSTADYGEAVAKCKSDIEAFNKSVSELSVDAGVQRDAEIREAWDEFRTSYDSTITPYTQLIDVYSAWHTFTVGWDDVGEDDEWWVAMDEAKVRSLTSPLTSSSNAKLKAYGDGFVAVRWRMVSTYRDYQTARAAYYSASYRDSNYTALRNDMNAKYEVYDAANDADYEYRQSKPDVDDTESLVGVDIEASDHQFLSKFSAVSSKIYAKYLEESFREAIGV